MHLRGRFGRGSYAYRASSSEGDPWYATDIHRATMKLTGKLTLKITILRTWTHRFMFRLSALTSGMPSS